jgi:hypothetical protein
MAKCIHSGQPLTLAERAKLTMICNKWTKKFEMEIAPNIGKPRDGEPAE